MEQNQIKQLNTVKLALRAWFNEDVQSILNLLKNGDTFTVRDLEKKLKKDQSITSQALLKMRMQNLVEYKREGKFHKYSIKKAPYKKLLKLSEMITRKQVRDLSHEYKRQILDLCDGSRSVKEIYKDPKLISLDIEQSLCSRFLAELRDSGLVTFEIKSRKYYYSKDIKKIANCYQAIDKFCTLNPKKN